MSLKKWEIKRPALCAQSNPCAVCGRLAGQSCMYADEAGLAALREIARWPRPENGWTDEEVDQIKQAARAAYEY